MNWLMNIIFPKRTGTVRINPNHLPGLTPPKSSPFTPRPSTADEAPEIDIKAIYKRFIEGGGDTQKRKNNDRGVGF